MLSVMEGDHVEWLNDAPDIEVYLTSDPQNTKFEV